MGTDIQVTQREALRQTDREAGALQFQQSNVCFQEGRSNKEYETTQKNPTMNLSTVPSWSLQHFGLINPKGNWPEPSAHLHPSFPDNQHITVLTPNSITVAVDLGDKMLFLKSWEKEIIGGKDTYLFRNNFKL